MTKLDDYPMMTAQTRKSVEALIKQSTENYTDPVAYFYDYANLSSAMRESLKAFDFPKFVFKEKFDATDHREAIEDFENIKRVYGGMMDLPLTIATNFNFWGLLTHTVFWSYMQHRWPVSKSSSSRSVISRYLNKDQPRSRNGVSRLWWLGYLTYRKELTDPWYFTRIMMENKDSDLPRMIVESPTTTLDPKAINAILWRLQQLEKESWYLNIKHMKAAKPRRLFRAYFQRYNMFGGIKAWSVLNQDELNQQCNRYILDFLCEEGCITESERPKIELEFDFHITE